MAFYYLILRFLNYYLILISVVSRDVLLESCVSYNKNIEEDGLLT